MPVWLQTLRTRTQAHPFLTLLGLGVVGLLGWWWLVAPDLPAASPRTQGVVPPIPGHSVQQASLAKTLLDTQQENARLKAEMQEAVRSMQQREDRLTAAERDRAGADQERQAQEQRLTHLLDRAQQALHRQESATAAPRRETAPGGPVGGIRPGALPVPKTLTGEQALEALGKVRIFRPEKPPSFAGDPPAVTRGDTPYLPAGSYAEGRVVTGVLATAYKDGALPVLFAVSKAFAGPYQLGGPGIAPTATALPLAGCLILGAAQADLGSGRVIMQLDTLSCVFPEGETFERAMKGYAVGADGTLGVPGRLETRDTAVIAKAFLTSLLHGAAESFALAKRTVIVTPFGGTTTAQHGQIGQTAGYSALATAAARLSEFYLSQAERLMPVLWVSSGTPARLVFLEGLTLDGLPTITTITREGQ